MGHGLGRVVLGYEGEWCEFLAINTCAGLGWIGNIQVIAREGEIKMAKKKRTNSSEGYAPPFTVSAGAISMVAENSALIERYSIRLEQHDALR